MEEYICEVDLAEIRVSPFQPRRTFAEEELLQLASSISHFGIIQPPVVRKIVQNGKALYYELIAGERRWRAAQKAGLKMIPVIVRISSDEDAAEASLIENVQRVDLNPIEMAEAFRKLISVFRLTQEEIAKKVGKKRSTVANYLRLLTLPSSIQESIHTGAITMGHAKAILALEDPELRALLHNLILTGKLSVRKAEDESAKIMRGEKKKKEKEVHVQRLEEMLEKRLHTKVRIAERGKKGGQIVIDYYSLEDLDRLLSTLSIEV